MPSKPVIRWITPVLAAVTLLALVSAPASAHGNAAPTTSTLARMKESTSSTTSDNSATVVLVAMTAVVVAAGLTIWLIARRRSRSGDAGR